MTYKTVFQIINLRCSGCAQTIKTTLRKFAEVKSIELDFTGSSVTVEYQADESFSHTLKEALTKIGFLADPLATSAPSKACCNC